MRLNRIIAIATVSAVAALGLTGCIMPAGTGPTVSEERDIEAVTTLVLDSSGDVNISEGEPSLVIHAQQSAIGRLTSEVSGDTLTLGDTGGFMNWRFGEVRYDLTLPDLETLELNGSGDIESAHLAPTVRSSSTSSGSGDIEFSSHRGRAGRGAASRAPAASISLATPPSSPSKLDGAAMSTRAGCACRRRPSRSAVPATSRWTHATTSRCGSPAAARVEYTGDPVVDSEVSGLGRRGPGGLTRLSTPRERGR